VRTTWIARDSRGNPPLEAAVPLVITVTNRPDPPVANPGQVFSVPENTTPTETIGIVQA